MQDTESNQISPCIVVVSNALTQISLAARGPFRNRAEAQLYLDAESTRLIEVKFAALQIVPLYPAPPPVDLIEPARIPHSFPITINS